MKKALFLAVLLAAVPAFAQRGGSSRPLANYAETCSAYGTVTDGSSCSGYPRQWCVNYSTDPALMYSCNPFTLLWEVVGSVSSGGGGGTTITLQSNGSSTFIGVGTLDFQEEFGLLDAGGGRVEISINDSVLAPNMTNATNTLAVARGGTGAGAAAGARANLGAAASGANADITALLNLLTALSVSQGGTGLNAVADNQLFLGIAANTFQAVTVASCPDSGGNHLNYSGHAFTCGNSSSGGGGSGYATFQNAGSGLTVRTVANFATSGGGTALAAADNSGSTRTDVTLTTTPTGATAVVGSARSVASGAGLAGGGTLAGDLSLVTASQEPGFLADGGSSALTGGASAQGKMQVLDNGVLEFTDGAPTSVVRRCSLGDSSGNGLTGADATSFFQAGFLPVVRGGLGTNTLGTAGQVLYNKAGAVGTDSTSSSFTYDDPTDTLTVGTLVTTGAADNDRKIEFQRNSGDVAAPLAGFMRCYASGTAGSEVLKCRTATGGIVTIDTLTGANTLTNHVIAGASNDLSLRMHATDCTALTDGVSGEPCYEIDADTLYVCEPASGLCDTAGEWKTTAGGGGSGDITGVWQTLSGAANAIVGSAGDSLDASAADFLRVPYGAAPTIDANAKAAVDSSSNQLVYMSGSTVYVLDPVRTAGAVLESLTAADDSYEFFEAPAPVTITGVSCRCRGACSTAATFTLEDRGGNAMTITGTNPTCSTTGNSTFAAVTAGNALVAGEGLAFDVTNTPTTGDTYTLTVTYLVARQ